MALLYTFNIPQPDDGQTRMIQSITVGSRVLQFTFQWASVSQEQYDIIQRYLDNAASSDPLISGDAYIRNYDYLNYYLQLKDMSESELNTWLDSNPTLPKSITFAPRHAQLVLIAERVSTCTALEPTVSQYKEVLRWGFKLEYNGEVNVGLVEIGGWYRNQDPEFSFRFTSDLSGIRYNDLGNVTIEFEVYNA